MRKIQKPGGGRHPNEVPQLIDHDGSTSLGTVRRRASGIYYRGDLLLGDWVETMRSGSLCWFHQHTGQVFYASAIDGYMVPFADEED